MKYESKSFTVASPGTKQYADNWERTFRGEQSLPYPPDESFCTHGIKRHQCPDDTCYPRARTISERSPLEQQSAGCTCNTLEARYPGWAHYTSCPRSTS